MSYQELNDVINQIDIQMNKIFDMMFSESEREYIKIQEAYRNLLDLLEQKEQDLLQREGS